MRKSMRSCVILDFVAMTAKMIFQNQEKSEPLFTTLLRQKKEFIQKNATSFHTV